MILKILQNSKKTINMTHFEESDYGFFCDLEQDNYILYPKQKIGTTNLKTIIEETQRSTSSNKLNYDNFKNDIYNTDLRTILIYILISFSSVYLTSKLFYKLNP
jgi:hypothetical protein